MRCLICDKETNRKYALYCDEHRTEIFVETGRSHLIEDSINNPITNDERWAIIGANSNIAAMQEVIDLRKPKLVMSKL